MAGYIKMCLSFLLVIYCCCVKLTLQQYAPPKATIVPFKPAGLRISVPHQDGMTLVAFHIFFNEEFFGVEAGHIARDIRKPRDGRWTYEDKTSVLKLGDVINYWIHVDYRGGGYDLLDQTYTVTGFYDYQGNKVTTTNVDAGTQSGGCKSSVTCVQNANKSIKNPCTGDILFDENFRNQNRINRNKWTIVEQFAGLPDYEFIVYRDRAKNIVLKNGLKIKPDLLSDEFDERYVFIGNMRLHRCTGHLKTHECQRQGRGWNILPPVNSGRLNTNKSLKFRYGRVEIRAKLPRGDWIYPLILLESVQNNSIQIRIASSAGNADLTTEQGHDISGHYVWGGVIGLDREQLNDRITGDRTVKYNDDLWSQNFHNYELIWSERKIVLKVDGEMYEEKSVRLPDDSMFFLTIGLAVGGVMEFPDNSVSQNYTKPWRNVEAKAMHSFYNASEKWFKTWHTDASTLEVEHVKVWAL